MNTPSNASAAPSTEPRADVICISDLEVFCRVGVPEVERAHPQRLLLSVGMEYDVSAAAAADDLARTIDYGAVARRLIAFSTTREWRLIETLAVAVADLVREEFGARRVSVEVKKFILPQAHHVSVRIHRG